MRKEQMIFGLVIGLLIAIQNLIEMRMGIWNTRDHDAITRTIVSVIPIILFIIAYARLKKETAPTFKLTLRYGLQIAVWAALAIMIQSYSFHVFIFMPTQEFTLTFGNHISLILGYFMSPLLGMTFVCLIASVIYSAKNGGFDQ